MLAGCIDDKCGTVVCANEGICVDGKCTCLVGYEGAACETAWVDRLTGKWNANDGFLRDTTNTRVTYDIQLLSLESYPDSFLVEGLSDSFENIKGYRTTMSEFNLQPEQVLDSFVTIKNGKGKLSASGEITGLYTFRYRGFIDTWLPSDAQPSPAYAEKILIKRKVDTLITVNFKWVKP